ncbi:MAG: hypothetical protein IJ489_04590 [Clostridia bacterium]|nr:hypothetical protein [Clostridia bacterium]
MAEVIVQTRITRTLFWQRFIFFPFPRSLLWGADLNDKTFEIHTFGQAECLCIFWYFSLHKKSTESPSKRRLYANPLNKNNKEKEHKKT